MKPDEQINLTVKVRRGEPGESSVQVYEVPYESGQSVLGVLEYIYENLDSTLSFYYSCRIGMCTGCLVRVNGKAVLACTTLAKGDMLIEPYKEGMVIKDLVARLPSLTGRDR